MSKDLTKPIITDTKRPDAGGFRLSRPAILDKIRPCRNPLRLGRIRFRGCRFSSFSPSPAFPFPSLRPVSCVFSAFFLSPVAPSPPFSSCSVPVGEGEKSAAAEDRAEASAVHPDVPVLSVLGRFLRIGGQFGEGACVFVVRVCCMAVFGGKENRWTGRPTRYLRCVRSHRFPGSCFSDLRSARSESVRRRPARSAPTVRSGVVPCRASRRMQWRSVGRPCGADPMRRHFAGGCPGREGGEACGGQTGVFVPALLPELRRDRRRSVRRNAETEKAPGYPTPSFSCPRDRSYLLAAFLS